MPYFSSFSTLWPNDLEEIGHGQRSLYVTHLFMLVIICANHRKNSSRTVCTVDRKRHEEIYFSSFIAQSRLNDLEDIGQGQGSLRATHPYRLVIICATYGKSPSRTVHLPVNTVLGKTGFGHPKWEKSGKTQLRYFLSN